MRIGDEVKIKECHKIPELVGEEAVIMALTDQALTKYPVAVKISSGEHEGKFCGFREDELELVPKGDDGIPPVFLKEAK